MWISCILGVSENFEEWLWERWAVKKGLDRRRKAMEGFYCSPVGRFAMNVI